MNMSPVIRSLLAGTFEVASLGAFLAFIALVS